MSRWDARAARERARHEGTSRAVHFIRDGASGDLTRYLTTGRTSEPLSTNLPATRSSFVGREREMLEIKQALTLTRLLTLTGAGGTGKTRLALEVARDLVEAYPDGAWLVELACFSEEALVPKAVAEA